MKCDDENILRFLEGRASSEMETHIRTCEKCSRTAEELSLYRKVLPSYKEGRKLLDDLDVHVKSFDEAEVRHLPPRIEELLRRTDKEKAQGSDGTVRPFARSGKKTQDISEESAMPLAMAAIPKDLVKPKKWKDGEKGKDEKGN